MNPFDLLSQDKQVSSLRLLGENALREFGVTATDITPLVHMENTTFRVASDEGVFNLRISRPGYQSTENVQSELTFLAALRDAGFRVPRPWQSRLITASHPDVPEARNCVLLGWMEGEFAKSALSPDRARIVGRTMADLHNFSIGWALPKDFRRQDLHAWSRLPASPMVSESSPSMADETDRHLVLEVNCQARELLSSLPTDAAWRGLIHADLHYGNLLFEEDGMNVIDFDDTGWGCWQYDLASALAFQVGQDSFWDVRKAMLHGYQEVRPLPPRTHELLSPFLELRLAGVANWSMSRTDNPNIRDRSRSLVKSLCDRIRWLRGHQR